MRNLQDMTVIITGASSGIGAALARELAKAGARLALAARRRGKLDALNAALGGGHLVVECDVAKLDDCRRLIDTAGSRFGRIDTLVANAGYGTYDTVDRLKPQAVRDMFATNVFGTVDCCTAAAQLMRGQPPRDGFRGQLMIVSSIAGRRGVPYLGVYSGTKAAQLAIAEAMRVELKPRAIAVTSVHPIMTRTEFGSVAEAGGAIKLPRGKQGLMTQSVDHVARRMAAAIARPRPEVWPHRLSRWLVGLGTLAPSVIDRGMARYRDQVERANPPSDAPDDARDDAPPAF